MLCVPQIAVAFGLYQGVQCILICIREVGGPHAVHGGANPSYEPQCTRIVKVVQVCAAVYEEVVSWRSCSE